MTRTPTTMTSPTRRMSPSPPWPQLGAIVANPRAAAAAKKMRRGPLAVMIDLGLWCELWWWWVFLCGGGIGDHSLGQNLSLIVYDCVKIGRFGFLCDDFSIAVHLYGLYLLISAHSCWFLPVVVWDVPFVGPNLVAIYPVACELLYSLLIQLIQSVGPFITCLHLKLKWLQPLSFNWTTCRPPPSDARKTGMVEGNLLDEPGDGQVMNAPHRC